MNKIVSINRTESVLIWFLISLENKPIALMGVFQDNIFAYTGWFKRVIRLKILNSNNIFSKLD